MDHVRSKKLRDELEELFEKLEFNLEEVQAYSQASYQVVCDLGRNQHNHSTMNTGYNAVRNEMLVLAKKLGEVDRQVTKVKQLAGLEDADVEDQ